ncbi:Rhodanese-related sulfurtransferase [Desulfomicrobium norvegicum]|uniref:Rhodanese-related sulfurtransferase n=1 Tax=Desulfomicrobium norvegicum (strain DSM 1741 / NCIMB 8310) TaxID=52561 RepID=A0A8G2F9A8_DESNO|nr:rhodanese-like domain-containing protein [Desulfomicrobium norvegicum]SFM14625.1 Rhodanese-related sulfurtransferase [Desulfomicrobium norvegicum]
MGLQEISALAASKADAQQTIFLDVRTSAEFSNKRPARSLAFAPLTDLAPEDFAMRHGILPDTPLIILCTSGSRARKAAEKFIKAGFSDVKVLQGGIDAWEREGLPLVGANSAPDMGGPISLDRQVRIAAGSLVLLFGLLGYFVTASFVWGAIFVGGGLVFAGITNTCGMAMLLTRAPWNKTGCTGGVCPISGKPKGSSGGGCK